MFSRFRYVFPLMLLLGVFAGCSKSLPKPKAEDWGRRELEGGVSLEAPYKFTANPNPLPGYVNIASYMPETTPNAIEVRIDVLQPALGVEKPTLDQFAKRVFAVGEAQAESPETMTVEDVKVGGLEGKRNQATNKQKNFVESLIFKKGEFYWLIEVYCLDESLAADAKRVLDSVKVE